LSAANLHAIIVNECTAKGKCPLENLRWKKMQEKPFVIWELRCLFYA